MGKSAKSRMVKERIFIMMIDFNNIHFYRKSW